MRVHEARDSAGAGRAAAAPAARVACEVRDLAERDRSQAIDVLARAFRDNPLNVAVVRGGPRRRVRANRHGARAMFAARGEDTLRLCAVRAGARGGQAPLGVLIGAPPRGYPFGAPPLGAQLRCLLGQGWGTAQRWSRVYRQLDDAHPPQPHWYLDVLGVEPAHQGEGVGSRLLDEWIALVDAAHGASYLETDRPENLAFYARVGFEATRELRVMGVPVWCLWRPARAPRRPAGGD